MVIVRNCSTASAIRTSYTHVWKKIGIRSLCVFNGKLICLHQHQSGRAVEIVGIELPSVRKATLEVEPTKLKKINTIINISNIKYVFSVSSNVVGFVGDDKKIILCKPNNKKCYKITDIKTSVKPQHVTDGCIAYIPERSEVINHLRVNYSAKDKEIKFSYSSAIKTVVPPSVSCLSVWGSTFHVLSLSHTNGVYRLIEYGNLAFGLSFSKALNSFYSAISYRPRGYVSGNKKTLRECVDLAQPFLEILNSMQSECEERFPSRKVFLGNHGTVWSDTVWCIKDSVSNWKAVLHRLDTFDPTLSDKVDPHAVNNENLIENSFGFTKTQGQSTLQSMQEYCYNKSRHEVDFQLKLCDLNFCQKVKVKLRDKSYQEIDESQKCKLEITDILEVLLRGHSNKKSRASEAVSVSHHDENILKQSFLLSKSVPHQSNRAKWKEQINHKSLPKGREILP